MEFLKLKISCKTSFFFLNDVFIKTIDIDVFDDVLQNAKHCANDASPKKTNTRTDKSLSVCFVDSPAQSHLRR